MDISRPSLAQSITCVALLGEMTFTVYLAGSQQRLHLLQQLWRPRHPQGWTHHPGGGGPHRVSRFHHPDLYPWSSCPGEQAEPENQSSGQCEISQPDLPVSEAGKPEFRGATTATAEKRRLDRQATYSPSRRFRCSPELEKRICRPPGKMLLV